MNGKGRFACSKCGRVFTMKMHLGRHMHAKHGRGGPGKRKVVRRGRPRGAKRTAALAMGNRASGLVSQLQSYHSELKSQMEGLESRMGAVAGALAALAAGGAGRKRRGRGRKVGRPRGKRGAARRTGARGRRRSSAGRRGRRAGRGGAASRSGSRRGALQEVVLRVLGGSGRPMSPQEIANGVIRTGYPTKSKNLARVVSNTLPKLRGIKRAGFGKYRV